jgi:polysaccharide pyruvyl transferase WcaK-like protein
MYNKNTKHDFKNATIGLMDHVGGGNLGDDTTQTAVIECIRRRWPGAAIQAFSMNPPDTEARHSIPAYPIRRETWGGNHDWRKAATSGRPKPSLGLVRRLLRVFKAAAITPRIVYAEIMFLLRSLRILGIFDIFVISGGGQLLDSWGGTWGYPYTIYKWVVLAKLSGAKCYFLNVGAGPLKRPLSKFFIKRALYLADYVSLRDIESKALLREMGFKGGIEVFPDCVYGLNFPSVPVRGLQGRVSVGLSPMAYCDPRRYWMQDQVNYESFKEKIINFGTTASISNLVTLFSTDIWFDGQTLEEIDCVTREKTQADRSYLLDPPVTSLRTLIEGMSSMDIIITCRFHGVVFAHLMNIPVIALSHHPKVTTLMRDIGLSEYCLDVKSFDEDLLTTTFNRMIADRSGIKARMAEKRILFEAQLGEQFDRLFPLADNGVVDKGVRQYKDKDFKQRVWTKADIA